MPLQTNHTILGGKVQLFRRGDSQYWWCAASVGGKQRRATTKEENLALAKTFAEDWYLELRGKSRAGLLKTEKTFANAAAQFSKEYGIITEGQRSPRWIEGHNIRLRLHLLPFFGELGVSEVSAGKVQEYRVHRATTPPVGSLRPSRKSEDGKPVAYQAPARSTLHDEVVTLRLVLKTAIRHGWLAHLPDLSPPYRTQGKIVHRPWFSPDEYKQLYQATREYARKPFHEHQRWEAEQLHDYVLFLGNTGLRPDEARNLEHRDIAIADDEAGGEPILEIEVRGKRGVGYCKSMPGAVVPYQRLHNRPKPSLSQTERARRRRGEDLTEPSRATEFKYAEPTDKVFPGNHVKMFNNLLKRAKLKLDRDGNPRTAYSLRHTYICLRLMEGADIYQIAKNCRTSVEMIEKFYASHIKSTLDAAAINTRKQRIGKPNPALSKIDRSARPRAGDLPLHARAPEQQPRRLAQSGGG
jgi:integrase